MTPGLEPQSRVRPAYTRGSFIATGAADIRAWLAQRASNRRTPLKVLIVAAAMFDVAAELVVIAYQMATRSTGHAHFFVFSAGYLIALLGVAGLGLSSQLTSRFRLILLGAFGVFTFLPKFLMSVNRAVYFDEYGHWRHVNDMLDQHTLWPANSLIPITQYFPGLGAVTAGLHTVTRISTWHSGQIVVLAAHTASLFLIYGICRSLGTGEREAMIGALIFSLNPSFMYFDTQYAYESLALTLALAALWFAMSIRHAESRSQVWRRATGVIAFGVAAVLTHHVSSIIMAILLLAVALCCGRGRESVARDARIAVWASFLVVAAFAGVWLGFVAQGVKPYLAPRIGGALQQLLQRVGLESVSSARNGEGGGPKGHVPFSGSTTPLYERAAGFASPVIVLVPVLIAVWVLWKRRHGPRGTVLPMVPMVLAAGVYFLSLPLALTNGGGELAHRSWPFGYVGIAVLVAVAIRAPVPRRLAWSRNPAICAVAIAIVAVGNIAAGENVAYRFPAPYTFGSDTLSTTSEGIGVARWADQHLPKNTRVVTDRFTGELVTGYSHLRVPDPAQGFAYQIFYDLPHVSVTLARYLKQEHFEYLILDKRITQLVPAQAIFSRFHGFTLAQYRDFLKIGTSPNLVLVHDTANYAVYELKLP